jgi:hypothetical protein
LPTAALAGPELDVRLLVDHRERLVRQRVGLNNTLQWNLHDLWPELVMPGGALFSRKCSGEARARAVASGSWDRGRRDDPRSRVAVEQRQPPGAGQRQVGPDED